jgi:hypothetical protein
MSWSTSPKREETEEIKQKIRISCKRYRSPAPGFCDLLDWAAVVDDGAVVNKDGSLTVFTRKEDEASRLR